MFVRCCKKEGLVCLSGVTLTHPESPSYSENCSNIVDILYFESYW